MVLTSTHKLCFRAKIRKLELMFMKHYAPIGGGGGGGGRGLGRVGGGHRVDVNKELKFL